MTRQFAAMIVVLILIIVGAGLYIHTQNTGVRGPLVFSTIAAALITFFALISTSRKGSPDTPSSEAVRKAVAASIVVEYVILVGTFAFWKDDPRDPTSKAADITELLLTHFTTIVGVVIAFYFGASAYIEAKNRSQSRGDKTGSGDQPSVTGGEPPPARS